jgi:S-DNA-T family DNA segregation ATPase FtsK/SpoIIIE
VVLAAAPDPRKEVVSFRSLFPTKIALRLDTPSQVDMVLGDGMHQMGARADRIPAGRPGVGFGGRRSAAEHGPAGDGT